MADKLRLTAAEIAFLAATFDPGRVSKAPGLLGAGISESMTDALTEAGLACLVVRGLAVADEHWVQLAPDVDTIGVGLAHARHCLKVGLRSRDRAEWAILVDAVHTRFAITPLPHCFEFTDLEAAGGLTQPLVHMVRQFLSRQRGRTASITFSVDPPVSLTVAVDGAGRWTMIRDRLSDGISGLTEDEVFARFHLQVATILAATA